MSGICLVFCRRKIGLLGVSIAAVESAAQLSERVSSHFKALYCSLINLRFSKPAHPLDVDVKICCQDYITIFIILFLI